MKNYPQLIKQWLLPEPDQEIDREIDMQNIKTIYYTTIAVCIVQIISLTLFLFTKFKEIDGSAVRTIIFISASIILCVVGIIGADRFRRQKNLIRLHKAINIFVGVYIVLMIIWGMMSSIETFRRGEQIITFFTVELITVIFVRLRPLFSTILTLSSYTVFYIVLSLWVKPGVINPYAYFMMGLLSAAGAVIIYRTTANYIKQKNKAYVLNESLEIIANHDSATRLQNRHALNKRIPEYLNTDICVAMLDINKFKTVNDTYGHRMGDDVLGIFSDLLRSCFPSEEIYRYGGDEFLVVSCTRDLVTFRETLEELNSQFGDIHINGVKDGFRFSCSCGSVSAFPQNPTDFFNVIMQADEKLYEDKNRSRSASA